MHCKTFIAIVILSGALGPAHAGYSARESWIPVAGQGQGADRLFFTTLHLTDTSNEPNEVTLAFFPEAQPNSTPRSVTVKLAPQQSTAVDIGPSLANPGSIGSLRIRSKGDVVAQARVFSRRANETSASDVSSVFNAIPSQYAIGTSESTIVHVPQGARYKLYVAETHGLPLSFSVRTMAQATPDAERRLYLPGNGMRSWDLAQLFPNAQVSSLRVTGINGSGKIILAGMAVAPVSGDTSPFEMSLPFQPRHRIPFPELAAYVAVAIVLGVSAIYSIKTR